MGGRDRAVRAVPDESGELRMGDDFGLQLAGFVRAGGVVVHAESIRPELRPQCEGERRACCRVRPVHSEL